MHQKVARAVERAQAALDLAESMTYGGESEDMEHAIGDLIADLLHLAEARGEVLPSDMPTLVDRALRDYEYESEPDNCMEEV
jgi:hypothetical protein